LAARNRFFRRRHAGGPPKQWAAFRFCLVGSSEVLRKSVPLAKGPGRSCQRRLAIGGEQVLNNAENAQHILSRSRRSRSLSLSAPSLTAIALAAASSPPAAESKLGEQSPFGECWPVKLPFSFQSPSCHAVGESSVALPRLEAPPRSYAEAWTSLVHLSQAKNGILEIVGLPLLATRAAWILDAILCGGILRSRSP